MFNRLLPFVAVSLFPVAAAPQVGDPSLHLIRGAVYDSSTAAGIRGAVVLLTGERSLPEGSFAAISGSNGEFVLTDVPAGRYTATVEKPGYVKKRYESKSSTIEVREDSKGLTIEFKMVSCASISGRIVNPDNEALMGAAVELLQVRLEGSRARLFRISQTVANDLGEYRFSSVVPGRYYVSSYYRDITSVFGLNNRPKTEATTDDIWEDYVTTYYPGTGDPKNASSVLAKPGENLTRIDLRLGKGRAVLLSGAVEGLAPSASAKVFLDPADNSQAGVHQVFGVGAGQNSFIFRSVAPGDYALTIDTMLGSQRMAARAIVSATTGALRNIRLVLQPAPTLRGRVVMAEPQTGLPASLQLVLSGTGRPTNFPVPIRSDGSFSVGPILMDRYRLAIVAPGNELAIQSVRVEDSTLTFSELELDRTIDSLSVVVSRANLSIKGKVTDERGASVQRGLVYVVGANGQIGHTTVSDDGTFEVGKLVKGTYRVVGFADFLAPEEVPFEVLTEALDHAPVTTLGDLSGISMELVARRGDQN